MGLSHGGQAMLRNLCAIFGIPVETTRRDPPAALRALILVYGMPLQRSQPQRRSAANEILGAMRDHFDQWSPFVGALGQILIGMQELPFHFNNVSRTTDSLVQRYRNLSRVVALIKWSGLGAGAGAASAGNAGLTEAVKSGSIKAGLKKAGTRVIGVSALPEAIAQRAGGALPKGASAAVTGFAIVAATISLNSAIREMAEIKSMILHRFQNGKATDAHYKAVFTDAINPAAVKKYWEIK